jgi:hypothetical protein
MRKVPKALSDVSLARRAGGVACLRTRLPAADHAVMYTRLFARAMMFFALARCI